uniref:Uncharacterized protein n=1 Tax=Anguilla anguilla TaxID=7936 RepID=A0A0E9X269_ANGAN
MVCSSKPPAPTMMNSALVESVKINITNTVIQNIREGTDLR